MIQSYQVDEHRGSRMMAHWLREIANWRETETEFDGTISETRFFTVSKATWGWLHEYGALAAINLDDTPGIISVAAYVDPDLGWNGWAWMHDEFRNSGLNPKEYRL